MLFSKLLSTLICATTLSSTFTGYGANQTVAIHSYEHTIQKRETLNPFFGIALESSYLENSSNTASVYLNEAVEVSSLQLEIHFDSSIINVKNINNNFSDSFFDFSINDEIVSITYLFKNPINGTNDLFSIDFDLLSGTAGNNTYFELLVTNATNSSYEKVDIEGGRYTFFILENETILSNPVFAVTKNVNEAKLNDIVTFEISGTNLSELGSASFDIGYDKDYFEFSSYEETDFLSNNCSVFNTNTENLGTVSFSFIVNQSISDSSIIKLKFKTKANLNGDGYFTFKTTSLYTTSYDKLENYTHEEIIKLVYEENYGKNDLINGSIVIDEEKYKAFLTLSISEDANFAAGDLEINYGNDLLSFNSYKELESYDYFDYVLQNNNEEAGIYNISLIKMNSNSLKGNFLEIEFDFANRCENVESIIAIEGKDFIDSDLNSFEDFHIELEFKTSSLSHTYGEWIVTEEATCTETGLRERTCSVCGEKETETIPLVEHEGIWQVTKEATENSEGEESLICSVCGKVIETRKIPALPSVGSDNTWIAVLSSVLAIIVIAAASILIIVFRKRKKNR